jgi:hypothetical protein
MHQRGDTKYHLRTTQKLQDYESFNLDIPAPAQLVVVVFDFFHCSTTLKY